MEKTKLLYVDDEPINLQLFEINFEKKYDVLIAEDGIQGLEILDNTKNINIVISDMKMPYMNGIEFINTAKEKHSNICCYILTGYDITYEIQNALNTGLIKKYFKKPFNMREIEVEIDKAIANE